MNEKEEAAANHLLEAIAKADSAEARVYSIAYESLMAGVRRRREVEEMESKSE